MLSRVPEPQQVECGLGDFVSQFIVTNNETPRVTRRIRFEFAP